MQRTLRHLVAAAVLVGVFTTSALGAPAFGSSAAVPLTPDAPAAVADDVTPSARTLARIDALGVRRTGALRVRVIPLKLTDSSGDFSGPELTTLANAAFGAVPSLGTFYAEQSRGAVSISGSSTGQLSAPSGASICSGSSDRFSEILSWASQAAATAGVPLAADEYPMVVMRVDSITTPCVAAVGGRGYVGAPGAVVYARASYPQSVITAIMAHELGHNLGMDHEGDWSCTGPDGLSRVTLAAPASCARIEYASPFSVMGDSYAPPLPPGLTAINRWQAGWLAPAAWQEVDREGDYTLAPSGRAGAGVQLLAVNVGAGRRFLLEYRTGVGGGAYDAPLGDGLLVRYSLPEGGQRRTDFLLDMNPATSQDTDAALGVGQTFADPLSEASITLVSQDAGAAVVRVHLTPDRTPPPPPTVSLRGPDVRGCRWARASFGADDRSRVAASWSLDGVLLSTSAASATEVPLGCRLRTGGHTLVVEVRDADGNSASTRTPFTVQPPAAPRSLRAKTLRPLRVQLTWKAPARIAPASLRYRIRVGRKTLTLTAKTRVIVKLSRAEARKAASTFQVDARAGAGPWGASAKRVVRRTARA